MIVGVVSDTHDDQEAVAKAARLLLEQGAELVLHLGDIVAPFTLRRFSREGVKRLIAVYGNNCGERLGLLRTAESLGYEIHDWPHVVELAGRRIVMVHGKGPAGETRELVEALARSGRYDAVLYGHTHEVDVRRVGSTLVLNPGEACGCLTGRRTAAILDTETMEARVLEL
ncbi:phosphodiesterase [Pyrodictium occultum]|uniref:Phosphoesterase n=1 Tax=Pyrodictium occultum TaxID=2309 RepID=A0A0V8RU24_PYROC|nr:metallophosphoesterase [Pyrodictium occultum]KSW11561.1 phosphodiesterase [Pyrodictium occultum]